MSNRRRKVVLDEEAPLSWVEPANSCNGEVTEEPAMKKQRPARKKARPPSDGHPVSTTLDATEPQRDPQPVCLPQIDMYVTNLNLMRKGFLLKDRRSMALNDCDGLGQLIRHKYVIVELIKIADRRGEAVSLLVCSCPDNSEARERLSTQSKAGHVIDQIVDFELREKSSECLHCRAARQLFPIVVNEPIMPIMGDEGSAVDRLEEAPLMFAVKASNRTYGVVRKLRSVKCLTCNRQACAHTSALKHVAEQDGFDDQLECRAEEGQENATPVASISTQPIAFPPKSMSDPSQIGDVVVEPITATNGSCVHGHHWSTDDPVDRGWIRSRSATLYCRSFFGIIAKKVLVAYRKTGQCECTLEFDGGQNSVLNLSNVTLFHHGVLFECLASFSTTAQPLVAMWRTFDVVHSWANRGDDMKVCRTTLQNGWNAFIALLNMETEKRMCCALCGQYPDTIILDGHGLGLRQEVLDALLKENAAQSTTPVNGAVLPGSRHEQRILVRAARPRTLLRRFALGKDKDGRELPLTTDEYLDLRRDLLGTPLHAVVVKAKAAGEYLAKEGYCKLLVECARYTPVCGIVPLLGNDDVRQYLDLIGEGALDPFGGSRNESEALTLLQRHVPVWIAALQDIRVTEGVLPAEVLALHRQMLAIYDDTFEIVDRPPNAYRNISGEDRMAFFPQWPLVRGIGRYSADGRAEKELDADVCTKHKRGHPILSPGIVVYLCRHGICYGFSLMDKPESPRMPFVVFSTRWEQPPRIIIYDNACRLHIYSLNREPLLFKDTLFLVDRFHINNHSACSRSYDMRSYRTNASIKDINSSSCEQFNSLLIKLKPSLSYMKLDRFLKSLELFVTIRMYFK